MSDWLDKLAGEATLAVAPKSFYTLSQIAVAKGYCRSHAGKIIQGEMDAGRIKAVKVRIKRGQRFYPVPHYGPAK
jgi:predicted transcriptional regulator